MAITAENIENWFTYHDTTDEGKIGAYKEIREAGKHLAITIYRNTPPSADQSDAIRKVREAIMTANAAVACDGK